MPRMRWLPLAAILAGAACSGSYSTGNGGGGQPGANQVFMQNTVFDPAALTASTGTTVTWVNKDGFAHTVTSSSVPAGATAFNSGNVGGGGTFQVNFTIAGTYQYHCAIHGSPGSGMRGTVVVQ